VTDNVSDFISVHNANILDPKLAANFEAVSVFAARKNIALEDLSIEKHRLPFINWCTSHNSFQT